MALGSSKLLAFLIGTVSMGIVICVPKYDMAGFVPSTSIDYIEKPSNLHRDQVAMPSHSQAQLRSEANSSNARRSGNPDNRNDNPDRLQEPRFGFTNIGSTGTGYGVSNYAPAKIDLGGLILGAVIGVGTILVIPKLLYVLSGSYGAYARSDEGGFANTMTKLDDALARHGIDTTSCMQRAVCTYAKKAAETMREANDITDEEKVSSFDRMIETLTTNQVFRTAMRGTAIQEAVEAGRRGENCTRTYRHCGFSLETILSLISNLMSSVTSSRSSHETIPTATAL
ncbi:uncharacterized protein [Venturia canescens]|uniref:uncharacterized protein n=1 Tax=Venturia canescens TaxID=32260 RepID=UPI001C9CA852|nr:uncharacterized protein LOC122409342 [Venturia canescens]XP_043272768.1 uncharacterized protein LOC122409342 [Venturia canescens]